MTTTVTDTETRARGRAALRRRSHDLPATSRALTSAVLAAMRAERAAELAEEAESCSIRARIVLERVGKLRAQLREFSSFAVRSAGGWTDHETESRIGRLRDRIRREELVACELTLRTCDAYRDLALTRHDGWLPPAEAEAIEKVRLAAIGATMGRIGTDSRALRALDGEARSLRATHQPPGPRR